MRKELSPIHELVACEVCGRTILKGERTEDYVVPDGTRRRVCELCTRRAEGAGWLRESAHSGPPAPQPAEPRHSLLGRLRRRLTENGPGWRRRAEPGGEHARDGSWGAGPSPGSLEEDQAPSGAPAEGARLAGEPERYPEPAEEPALGEEQPSAEGMRIEEPAADRAAAADAAAASRERRHRRRLRDPRHVRAVPTNADAKVERALELFNASDHSRTVGALQRTLGEPWVTALPHAESTSEVTVVVAWELSWYQYRVDLGDSDEAVAVVRKGQELHEIDDVLRAWNASATADGALEPGGARI